MKKYFMVFFIILIISTSFAYEKNWKLVWEYPIGKPVPQISIMNFGVPGIVITKDNLLIAPTWNGKIYCFSNRKLLWKKDLGSPIYHDIKIDKDLILVTTYDGILHGISKKNGYEEWSAKFKNPVTSNIIVENQTIYCAAGKKIYSVSEEGKIINSNVLPTTITMLAKLKNFFALDKYGRVYRIDNNLKLISFFNINFNEQNPPFYFDGYAVFTTIQGTILFYKDKIEYNMISLPDGIISKPIISDDKKSFYILTSSGKLFQVNSKEIMNYYDSQFYAVGSLAKYNKKLYFPSIYGKMYVINEELLHVKEFNIATLPNNNIVFDSNDGFYFLGIDGKLYYYLKVFQ